MTYWDGDLRNTVADVVLDTFLLLFILVAYIPQIQRIVSLKSDSGISPYFFLFNTIFSTAQFSQAILFHAFAYPNDGAPVLQLIGDHRLHGRAAFGGILGLLQVFTQWTCSALLLATFSSHTSTRDGPRRGGITGAALAHAAVFLVPAVMLCLPKPKEREFGTGIIIGLLNMLNTVVAPFFAILQFYTQYLESRRSGRNPGSLSLWSLLLQVMVLTAVVVRWFLRLGVPKQEHWDPGEPWLWYVWGYLPINYVFHVIGCVALLAGYIVARSGNGHDIPTAERIPLLR